MQRIGERRRKTQADAADEILRLIAIEHDGVQDPQTFTASVEIKAQRERQPLPRAVRMPAFDPDDGAQRAALLDGHLFDRTLETLLAHLRIAGRSGAILAQQDQPAVAESFLSAARNGVDDVCAAAGQAAHELAGIDLERGPGFPDAHIDGEFRGVGSGDDFERSRGVQGARRQCMRGPLERSVRPPGERPALQAMKLLVRIAQREVLRLALFPARPRRAPGDALRNGGHLALEPTHPGAGPGVRRGIDRGAGLRTGFEGRGCESSGGRRG